MNAKKNVKLCAAQNYVNPKLPLCFRFFHLSGEQFELSGAALPRPVEAEGRNELERFVMHYLSLQPGSPDIASQIRSQGTL